MKIVPALRHWMGLVVLAAGMVSRAAAQTSTAGAGIISQAEGLLGQGKVEDAEFLLNKFVASHPNEGTVWLFLGRIYLREASRWHERGHPGASGPILLDFATETIEQAQQRVIDSSDVFRVVIEMERATNRIEEVGWMRGVAVSIPAEDLPLPPVLREFGRNLVASCPERGVLVTGGLIETASAWGTRLTAGVRPDLVLIRPDLYATDARYRGQMARAMGSDSAGTLAAALAHAGLSRPICLSPTLDSMAVAPLNWHPMRMALVGGRLGDADNNTPLSVFQLARTGLSGSVWGTPTRDLYDMAARRNHALCTSVFNRPDAQGLPPIPSCQQ